MLNINKTAISKYENRVSTELLPDRDGWLTTKYLNLILMISFEHSLSKFWYKPFDRYHHYYVYAVTAHEIHYETGYFATNHVKKPSLFYF